MSMRRRDWLRRFILLIDTLYYMHRNVVIEAESALEDLFDETPPEDTYFNADDHLEEAPGIFVKPIHDEEFAFERCLSRLHEM